MHIKLIAARSHRIAIQLTMSTYAITGLLLMTYQSIRSQNKNKNLRLQKKHLLMLMTVFLSVQVKIIKIQTGVNITR